MKHRKWVLRVALMKGREAWCSNETIKDTGFGHQRCVFWKAQSHTCKRNGSTLLHGETRQWLIRICNETKALEGYKDELKPKFKSTPTQFQTVIFASSDTQNVGDHDGGVSETKLTERQQKILNLIKDSPTITGKQMSETLSVNQRTIERDLSALQKKGIL